MSEAATTQTPATPAPTDNAPAAQQAAAPAAAPPATSEGAPQAAADATTLGTAPNDAGGEQQQQQESAKPKAPDSYLFTAPEGYSLDSTATGEFSALAKELDLTQEQAQKLIDLDFKRNQESAAAIKAESDRWLASLPGDKELGGEKLPENIAIAKKALAAFGTDELSELLTKTQLGNHPEIIRAFYRAGLQLSPDNKFISGGSSSDAGKRDAVKALYPTSQGA